MKARHAAATAHYEAECARLERETGLNRAAKLSNYLDLQLERATLALAAVPSRDLADVVSKARALAVIQATSLGECMVEWRDDLALNIGHDLLTVSEVAHASA